MNLFQLASRGIDLDALPDESAPEREPLAFEPSPAGSRFAVPQEFDAAFQAAGDEYGVDPDVLRAMAFAESRFRPDVISGQVKSRTGAAGLMQFMPGTAERFGINPLDPVESIFGAAAYMRANLEKFNGDYGKAVAAYNWGENRKAYDAEDWQALAPKETQGYLKTVFGAADELKLRAPAPPSDGGTAVQLPPGVAASTAGAGRGSVSPGMVNTKIPRAAVPDMTFGGVAQDVASGLLQVGPTAVKGVGEVIRLATGDRLGKGVTDFAERGIQATQDMVGSERAAAQRKNFAADMADDSVGLGTALANNKGALADQILPTIGSMFIPVGAAGAAGKLATVGKAARGLNTAALAARVASVQQAAGIGATAAQNAASTFAEMLDKGVPMQEAYTAAGITVPFSLIAGKLTGGGAEGALIKGLSGQNIARGVGEVGKGMLREGAQEGGESLGQVTGEVLGANQDVSLQSGAKRVGTEALLGAVMGGGMNAAQQIVPTVESQPTTPTAPVVPKAPQNTAQPTNRTAAEAADVASQILQAEQAAATSGLAAELEALRARSVPDFTQRSATPQAQPGSVPVTGGLAAELQALRARSSPQEVANAPQLSPSITQQQTQAPGAQAANVAGVNAPVPAANLPGAGVAATQATGVDISTTQGVPANVPQPAQPGTQASQTQSTQGTTTGARVVLQNRDRSTPSSIAQMRSIAARPDYGRLGFSRDFANGAPVVAGGTIQPAQMGRQDMATASDGRSIPVQYAVVDAGSVLTSNTVDGTSNPSYDSSSIPAVRAIAGNGRIAGLQSAYQSGNANAYRQELVQDASLHGIAPEVIAPMAQPVLVRVMPTEAVTADIGDISNTVGNLDLSAAEQASNDANRVTLDALQFAEDGSITPEVVRQFVRAMPQAEQGQLLDTNGQPTRQAVDRLSAAVFAKAYGNEGLTRLYSQAQDPEARLIMSALAQVAPKMARLEGAGALDIRDVVAQAAEIAVNARRQGVPLARAAQQLDMAADPAVGVVLDLFAANSRSVRPVVEALARAADAAYTEATKPAEDMFGTVPRATRADIINQLRPENERGSQKDLEDAAGRESAAVDAVGQANEPAGSAAPAEAQAGRPAEDAATEGLTSYTADEVTQRQAEAAQAQATAKRAEDAAARAEAAARQAKEIALRSVAAADSFELGQSGEDNLSGQGGLAFSFAGARAATADTPIATIRQSLASAYGNLLQRLEGKGLVTLTQTQDEAIEAAARARADKTGKPLEEVRASLMGSVSNSKYAATSNVDAVAKTPSLNARSDGGVSIVDAHNLDIKRSADGAIEGFFDPQTGQSFLIADNLTAQSAPGTLMHEVGIHMAADGKLQPLFDRAAQLLKVGRGNAFIQRVQARMDKAGETSNEEAAAYIVTEYENDRTSAPASVSKWVQDFIASVRAWLFNKGVLLKADQLTVADIAAVARANARGVAGVSSGGGEATLSQRVRSLWEKYSDSVDAFRFGNTEEQRSTDVRTLARAFSSDDTLIVGKGDAETGYNVALADYPDHTMTLFPQANGRYKVDATQAAGSSGARIGDNVGQRMYQTLFALAHNKGLKVDADLTLSPVNELRRTSAMLSSALRFDSIDHFGRVNDEQQVDGWNPESFSDSVQALAAAELSKVEQRVPVSRSLEIDPVTGDVYTRDSAVLESIRGGLDSSASMDGRIGSNESGESGAGNLAELEARLARGAANPRRVDGVAQDAVPTLPGNPDTVGNGASIQGNRLSDSELARYLASTRGGFEAHGVGVSTLKRALITRDHAGTDVPGLLYSKAGNNPPPIPTNAQAGLFAPSNPWELPQATRTDRLIYELQDGRIDLKRVQEAIAATGKQITEGFDARLAETLMPGRIARRTESFLAAEVKPLLESMAKNNVSQDELSDYLLARHAPERNAQIAKVNDEMPDGGAGTNSQGVLMTTQAARDHIAALTQGKRLVLELMAKRVDELTLGTREVLVREGLEKQETVDAWTGAYKHYVPLFKDEAMETPGHPIGAGVSVTGTASKRATGSTGEVTNMLAHILMQREAAITRAEKNRVAMSLYGLALTNPNAEMWTTIRPSMPSDQIANELVRMGVDPMEAQVGMQGVPTIRGVDPVSGKVVDRPNPMYKRLDNSLVVKVNGEDRVILFNARNERAVRLVRNLKNQDGVLDQLDLAGSIVGKATRYFAAINTQYNPAFGMVNVVRDMGGAMVNLTDTALAGKQARVLSDSIPAMIGIARDLRGDAQRTPWSDLWTQFQDDGGRTGYRDLFIDPYKRADAVQSELDKLGKDGKLTPGAAAHAVLDLLDDFNTTLENGVRLSAYKAALDKGMSRAESARLARELTLDFNRKGRAGREMGPLFAFFNASVQGTARTLKALQGPAGKRILVGGLSLGVIQALLLSMAGYEDDEIPEFVKARAFIIPLAGKQYITIPLQFGLNALPNTGRVVTELLMSGGKDWGEKSFNALGELAGSFNPLGGGNIFTGAGALKTISPTVIDPIVDMATNTDFTGKPIGKERMPWDTRPGFTMGREGTQRSFTGQAYIGISKAINSLTGGNDFAQGLASPSPEEVRYVFTTVGGGVYRELEKILNASVLTAQGEGLKAREVPLGSRFAGEVEDQDLQRSRFFKNSSKIEKLEAQLKGLSKEGRGDEVRKLIDDSPLVKLYELNDEVRSNVTKLNKLASESINDKEALKRIDAARTTYMRALNDKVLEMEKAGDKAASVPVRRSPDVDDDATGEPSLEAESN